MMPTARFEKVSFSITKADVPNSSFRDASLTASNVDVEREAINGWPSRGMEVL